MKKAKSSSDEGQSSFILNKKPIPDVTLIVHEKSLDKNLLVRIIQECCTPYFYHKFIIGNIGTYSKKYILKAISNFVYPASFRALHYTVVKNKAVFLSRNCQEILLKICSENFRITNPECPENPFKVIILANFILYEEVQMEDDSQSIIDVIKKRFKNETETIDLSEFSEDKGLTDYYPLFQIKFMLAVTSTIAEFSPKHLNLQNNCIRDISNLHPLKDFIESIDLSNNMIEDISALMPLINFKTLKNLRLSGNPFCEKYDNYNYVLDVKRYCQTLEKLDGFDVTIPVFQKNNFCTPNAIDLVKSFMEHFFTVYDSYDRDNLKDLYDKEALFSVTAKIVPNQKNSSSAQSKLYMEKIQMAIPCDIFLEQEEVSEKAKYVEWKESLKLFQDTHVSLVIGGVFKELQQILSFTRHFVFKRSDDTYVITNDQYHVSNALDFQTGWSFGFPMHLTISGNPLPYFQEEYRELEEVVHKITTMNYRYSQKYLDRCQYDLKKTLQLFTRLHLRGDVPEDAFTPESATPQKFQQGVLPYSENIRMLVYKKHKSINLKTVWETLHSERMRTLSHKPLSTDPTIKKIYRNVIIPTIEDSPKAFAASFKPIQDPKEANPKPVSFNIQIPLTAKDKPIQKVKPATKANLDPLVELAEKIAKHKELANKKVNELRQTGPGPVNQAVAAVPSIVPPPSQYQPVNLAATNFSPSSILGRGPRFTPAAMGSPFLPGMMQPIHHLMPAQFQMHAGFSAQQGFPMPHRLPVPDSQGAPRPLFPIANSNYQSVVGVPKVTVPTPATAVSRPKSAVPVPTGVALMPRGVGVSSQFNQLRATVPPNATGSNLRPSGVLLGVLENKGGKRAFRKRLRFSRKCRKLLAKDNENLNANTVGESEPTEYSEHILDISKIIDEKCEPQCRKLITTGSKNLEANTVQESELTECSEENISDVNKIMEEKYEPQCRKFITTDNKNLNANTVEESKLSECSEKNILGINKIIDCEPHKDDEDNVQSTAKKGRYNPGKRQRFLNKCRKLIDSADENLNAITIEKSELTECSEVNNSDEKCESHKDDEDIVQSLAKEGIYNPSKRQRFSNKCKKLIDTADEYLNANTVEESELTECSEVNCLDVNKIIDEKCEPHKDDDDKKGRYNSRKGNENASDDFNLVKSTQVEYTTDLAMSESDSPVKMVKKINIKLNRLSKSATDTTDVEYYKPPMYSDEDGVKPPPTIVKKMDIKLNRISKSTLDTRDEEEKKTSRQCSNKDGTEHVSQTGKKLDIKLNLIIKPGENPEVQKGEVSDNMTIKKTGRPNHGRRQRFLIKRWKLLAKADKNLDPCADKNLDPCTDKNPDPCTDTVHPEPTECSDVNEIINKKSEPHEDDNLQSPAKRARLNPSRRRRLLRYRQRIECSNENSSEDVNKIIDKKSGPHIDDNWRPPIGDVNESGTEVIEIADD